MLVWSVWCYPDTCLELLKVIWSWAVFPDGARAPRARPHSTTSVRSTMSQDTLSSLSGIAIHSPTFTPASRLMSFTSSIKEYSNTSWSGAGSSWMRRSWTVVYAPYRLPLVPGTSRMESPRSLRFLGASARTWRASSWAVW